MLLVDSTDKPEYTPSDSPSYAEHFLQNRYTLVYAPSTSVLQLDQERDSNNPSILVLANPFGRASQSYKEQSEFRFRTGWRFDPLIFAQKEAQGIEAISSNVRVFEREQATKHVFLREAPNHEVIHFATHAFVDTTFDAFSGLVLATGQDSTDDGLLMGYEISDLELNCDLVTLSACETGRGKIISGEGVMGLPRLFLGAGAKSVLMTQWKVDDKFASELMPMFYNYYLEEGFSKADALAEAKRDILKEAEIDSNIHFKHPFYWASFTLYGDPGQERKSTFWYKASVMVAILILVIVIIVRKRANLKILP